MKKVLALIMCVAMIASFAVIASAETKDATFTFKTVDGKGLAAGDTVTITMDIAEAKTLIGAIGFKISYDDEYLKFIEDPTTYSYFNTGVGAGGATAAGNEETMEIQMATADGFKAPGTVLSLTFELKKAIPEGKTAVVTAEVSMEPKAAEGDDTYNVKIVPGGVTVEKTPTPEPPSSTVEPSTVESKDGEPKDGEPKDEDTTTGTNPKTGDVSAVAVAAGLCAVMAAAFVITKKVND